MLDLEGRPGKDLEESGYRSAVSGKGSLWPLLKMKKEGNCGSADSLLPYPEGKDRGLVERENHTKE